MRSTACSSEGCHIRPACVVSSPKRHTDSEAMAMRSRRAMDDPRSTAAATEGDVDRLSPYLRRVAYSHLGSLSEAEDLIQEAWLRLSRVDRSEIRDLRAWLTTVISRLALDALTSARAR